VQNRQTVIRVWSSPCGYLHEGDVVLSEVLWKWTIESLIEKFRGDCAGQGGDIWGPAEGIGQVESMHC